MNKRGDWQLIRFLNKRFDMEMAVNAQMLPYIEISAELFHERIFPTIRGDENRTPQEKQQAMDESVAFGMQHLPWDQFLLRFPMMPFDGDVTTHGFAMIRKSDRSPSGIDNGIFAFLAMASPVVEDNDEIIFISSVEWDPATGGVIEQPNLSEQDLKIVQQCEVFCITAFAYLALCPERVVRTQSTIKPNRQMRKEAKRDISERTDLPTHILIDPTKAPQYQPPGMRPVFDALAKKRKPHARRAHWRRLPEQVVRVRESWIGCKEWDYAGRSYKVISPPGDRPVDRD